jgi:hypothetical protein
VSNEITDVVETKKAKRQPKTKGELVAQGSPADTMLRALERGASPEQIQQMMELQERWEANEARKAFNIDFANFKAEAVAILKNKTITDGPMTGKRYADLQAVVECLTPQLSQHGLSASWKLTQDTQDWIEVTCYLTHRLGHTESAHMGGPPDKTGAKNPIQSRASTVSYLERYTFKAVCGVAEKDQDDDGRGGKDVEVEDTPEELRIAAMDAALEGQKALREFLKSRTEKERLQLEKHSKSLVQAAKEADAAVPVQGPKS